MGEKWERVLSKAIGVNGIHINSALVSAQSRKRIYWTNIGMKPMGVFGDLESIIEQPRDKGILLRDILESDVPDKYYLSEKMLKGFLNHNKIHKERGNGFEFKTKNENDKSNCLNARYYKMGVDDNYIVASRGRNPENPKSRESGLNTEQMLEPRFDGKTNCLTSVQKDNLVFTQNYIQWEGEGFDQDRRAYFEDGKGGTLDCKAERQKVVLEKGTAIRRLTPTECKRLQTIPDWYDMSIVSDTQQYKMLGNGWTVDVIAHIFGYLPKHYFKPQ
jgi:DNA (cytosine-5)-methyltransferase 3A